MERVHDYYLEDNRGMEYVERRSNTKRSHQYCKSNSAKNGNPNCKSESLNHLQWIVANGTYSDQISCVFGSIRALE